MAKRKSTAGPEYRLLITPHVNERTQKSGTLVVLETTKAFASFRYELSVKEEVEGKTIQYTILGLKAPHLSLPSAGHAQFIREYENLKGTYTIAVEGLDGVVHESSVRIGTGKVELVKAPTSRFVEVFTDEGRWDEQRLNATPPTPSSHARKGRVRG